MEYITVENEAAQIDGRIAGMVQSIDQNIQERNSLEVRLSELEGEKQVLEMERTEKKLLNPDQEERLKVLDKEIITLKAQIENGNKSKADLEKELGDEKSKWEQLDKELKKAQGEIGAEHTKSAELNAQIMMMMTEVDQNKVDKTALLKELEVERKQKE